MSRPEAWIDSSQNGLQRRGYHVEMAKRIEFAWRKCGYRVSCTVEPLHDSYGKVITYQVRSNMMNGLPRM